jgi:RNA polymerase sigma-70 factor (ECF subfamily)
MRDDAPIVAPPETKAPARDLDARTVDLCRAGDEEAFARFVRFYEGPVMALLSRILGARADVEDLAQEVFLRAFRALPRFDPAGPATLRTWLLTIATRLALNDKRRARFAAASIDDVELADPETPERSRSRAELARAIERAAGELPIDQRAAFVLAEFHDLSMADIARALDVPENTAKTRIFRARERMRALLERFLPDAREWSDP